ncbi:MAG: ATPase, T2SS/T4P/T4SS family [Planctomycetota bacterium]|nr:type II secretion system protein GspE [Planctomycetota bacterium]MEE3054344.1 ATPase, T2SS/T4P/T4SS family [Planctomycetota bacterium]
MNRSKFDKRLGNILSRRNMVSEADLDNYMEEAESESCSLTQVLLEGDQVSESDLLEVLSEETRFPAVDVFKVRPEKGVVDLLPENLASYYGVVPVSRVANVLTLAVSNPFDILQLDDIRIVTACEIRPVLSTEPAIRKAIPEIYNRGQQMVDDLLDDMNEDEMEVRENAIDDSRAADLGLLAEESGQAPVVKLVNLIIVQGIKKKASDIHIEPLDNDVRVRYRVDGVLHESLRPPKRMQNALVSRIKIMCGLDIAERRQPQDGKFQITMEGRKIDFRVSTLPLATGEKVVMRILDSSSLSLGLVDLGFEEKSLEDIYEAIARPYGMILVTGPTGSGKSTTLYSAIREVMNVADNIVTVEDPIEYQLEGVNQVQVNIKQGLTFAASLRSILRQDPDTILIGEIRDQETVEIAVKAALTGHLVFSTLHTNDAPSSITRVVDMGVDPFLAASALVCVCAQRLARSLCEECSRPMDVVPPAEHLESLGFTGEETGQLDLLEAVGCQRCSQGYKGRFALLETMPITNGLQRVIIDGGSAVDIEAKALEDGMLSLRRCAVLNALKGRTSLEEILRVTVGD